MEGKTETKIEETETRYFEFQEQAKLELDNIQNDIERLMKNLESLVPENECDSDECSDDEAASAALRSLQENAPSTSNREDSEQNAKGDVSSRVNWDYLVQSIIGDLRTFKNLDSETDNVVKRINHIEEVGGDYRPSMEGLEDG